MRALWPWGLVGLAAAGLALGVAEFGAALLGAPSLIASVGALVIELQPPGAKDFVVRLFGEADKLALELATALGVLLVGGLLGVVARRDARAAAFGFIGFGLVAFFVLALDPLSEPVPAALTVVLAVTAGIVLLRALSRQLRTDGGHGRGPARPSRSPRSAAFARRRFVALGVGALAGGALLAAFGRYLTAQVPTITPPPPVGHAAETLPPPAPGSSFEVPGLTPLIVPNGDFYRIDTRLTVPQLEASNWNVRVHGMVERELTFSYAELTQMPLIEHYVTIACVSNEVGGQLVGNAKWTGVALRAVLEQAGVRPGATQLVGRSFDGWTAGFPTAHLDGGGAEAMIALLMNDEPLPAKHGFPLRLIVPGLFGYVSATKWLTEIELTTLEAFDAYWVPRGWAKEAPILTQSRIDVPLDGRTVAEGATTVAGVAWAPTRGIKRVEVQLDEEPWREARLSVPLADTAWVQWRVQLELPAGVHSLRVRATDGLGRLQEEGPTRPPPDGARGWHRIQVTVF